MKDPSAPRSTESRPAAIPDHPAGEPTFEEWKRKFVADATADRNRTLNASCDPSDGGYDDDSELVLDRTLALVQRLEDGQFLRMQTYDPTMATGAQYVIGVQSDGFGWARLISDKVGFTDLADFHDDYQLRCLVVRRPDGGPMSEQEHRHITDTIRRDIHFDHGTSVKLIFEWEWNRVVAEVYDENDEYVNFEDFKLKPGMRVGCSCEERITEGEARSVEAGRLHFVRDDGQVATVSVQDDVYYAIMRPSGPPGAA